MFNFRNQPEGLSITDNLLGKGQHGLVFAGTIRRARRSPPVAVAVKITIKGADTEFRINKKIYAHEHQPHKYLVYQFKTWMERIRLTPKSKRVIRKHLRERISGTQNITVTVMELCDGTLEKYFRQMSGEERWGIIRKIAEAIEYLHDRDIAVEDIKPANVLIRRRGQRYDVRLADFGHADQYREAECIAVSKRVDCTDLAQKVITRLFEEPDQDLISEDDRYVAKEVSSMLRKNKITLEELQDIVRTPESRQEFMQQRKRYHTTRTLLIWMMLIILSGITFKYLWNWMQ